MEINKPYKYIHKVNLATNNKIKEKLLKVETKKDTKNNNINNINKNNDIQNRKKTSNGINNDYEKNDFINTNNGIQNYSRKSNYINIMKNNSFNIGNINNEKEYLYNTIEVKNDKYQNFSYKQNNNDSDSEPNIANKEIKNSLNKSYLLKGNNSSIQTDIDENNSIFNQIISRFKKFNENYQKFIKHTTESNMFNYNIKTKSNNKSIDITADVNHKNKFLKDSERENNKNKIIKVNHMKKNKKIKNKNNNILNKSLSKMSNLNKKQNINSKNIKEISIEKININKENNNNILLKSNEFLLNKINNRRNIKNKYAKSKEKNIIHNKHNSYVNNNKTINYIPIDFRINSEKREFRMNRLYKKNSIRNNSEFKTFEIIHIPIKINKKFDINKKDNKVKEKNKQIYNKISLLNKVNNTNKINSGCIFKEYHQEKENEKNNNEKSLKDITIQQNNENSFFYNTNSTLNNIHLPELNTASEYESTIDRNINQLQSTFTAKNPKKFYEFKLNQKNEDINDRKKDYIKITENQRMKESSENDDSFFDKNSNKTQNNIVQKMSLYIKPIKSISKNKTSRINFSKEKLLYTKKNKINNLTTNHLCKLNNSIEVNKNSRDKINYIRQPIQRKIYINENNKEKSENLNIIENNDNINIESNELFYFIEKVHSLNRFTKYYDYYKSIPIKKICFIDKIRTYKTKKEYNEIKINKYNGYENIFNYVRNLNKDFIKNGNDDIKGKNMSNSYSKTNNRFKGDNIYEPENILHSKYLSNNLKNEKTKYSKKRSITEEKFELGCSKLNKILSKNSKMNHILNGLEINILNSQIKLNSTEIENKKNEFYPSNNIEKENGGAEKKYTNFSAKKNQNWYCELKDLLEKDDSSEKNELNNYRNIKINKINENDVTKNIKTEDYYYNIHPIKKSKNKKKSNSSNKIKLINEETNNKKEIIIDKFVYEQVDKDLNDYLKFLGKDKNKTEDNNIVNINYVYNWKIIDELMNKGKTKLEDIIKIYIEICKNRKISKLDLPNYDNYIKTIIEYYITDYSKNQIEIIHLNMIELFKSIIDFEINNSEIFLEILGNLFFTLLKNKLYYMKDLNAFTEKPKETQINIAKIVKYSILASGKCLKQYHNDFKFTKFFNNNEIFVNYVTNAIPELNKKA